MTRSTLARPVCSFNVLFFFFKILTFTRGFDTWGPLVRMIMKVLLGSSVPPPLFFSGAAWCVVVLLSLNQDILTTDGRELLSSGAACPLALELHTQTHISTTAQQTTQSPTQHSPHPTHTDHTQHIQPMFSGGASAFSISIAANEQMSKWKTGPVTDVSYACTLFWCCMFSNHGHELCVFSSGEDGTSRGRELPPFNQDLSK